MEKAVNEGGPGIFDEKLTDFLKKYSIDNKPIEVSFRNLVPTLTKADIATHLIHTYPAKLLMHIPHFFLNNQILSRPGDTVLDPFCGSGTVLLEAVLAKRRTIGADANPLARLVARVKTKPLNPSTLFELLERFNSKQVRDDVAPEFKNVDYWFLPQVKQALALIWSIIETIECPMHRDFFKVCFSNCAKKVSLADQRVSVPVRLRADRYMVNSPLYEKTKAHIEDLSRVDVLQKFREIVEANIVRFRNFRELLGAEEASAEIVSDDARQFCHEGWPQVDDQSVDLIITSPPYAGAQKYIRSSALSLGWLRMVNGELGTKMLEAQNIGREHYKVSEYRTLPRTGIPDADMLLKQIFAKNPQRAYIAANYLIEMRTAFERNIRLLKPNGYFVLVAANNQVCGFEFKTQEYLTITAMDLGLKVVLKLIDDIRSYGLMTKRNKTANIITREWVLVFQKQV